jgi:hypothetical protein
MENGAEKKMRVKQKQEEEVGRRCGEWSGGDNASRRTHKKRR